MTHTVHFGRSMAASALLAAVCLVATGCHRRQTAVLPPAQAQAPVALATPPDTTAPPVIQPQPLPSLPPVAVNPPPRRPKKKTIPPPPVPAPAPAEVASAAPAPAASIIGSLTAGEDSSPQKREQATDLLASIDKRLKALPATLIDEHRPQVARVRSFTTEAKAALKSGDTDGALTLATKAKLLLDDLTH